MKVEVELTGTVVFAGRKDWTMDRVPERWLLTWVGSRKQGCIGKAPEGAELPGEALTAPLPEQPCY